MKTLTNFKGIELTKTQQKFIIGGNEWGSASCTETCGSGSTVVSCTSNSGKCYQHSDPSYIQCDDDVKYDCPA